MTEKTVLFWDIDGTLLTTKRAGVFALEDATRELTGQAVDLATLPTDGLTDFQIARRILESLGWPADLDAVTRLIRRYEALLPASLFRRQGSALAGTREILGHLRAYRGDVASYLLTGNTPTGARAKLTHYGLIEFFRTGAFSDDLSDRADIARTALTLARAELDGRIVLDRVFVIGDTPHDIAAGKAIGAHTVAVASGVYSVADLSAHQPWAVLEGLPEPTVFERLIDRL